MQQDHIYVIQTADEQALFLIVHAADRGIIMHVFDEEPSRYTEPEQAIATVMVMVERASEATRLMLRLWGDTKARDSNELVLLSLREQEHRDG